MCAFCSLGYIYHCFWVTCWGFHKSTHPHNALLFTSFVCGRPTTVMCAPLLTLSRVWMFELPTILPTRLAHDRNREPAIKLRRCSKIWRPKAKPFWERFQKALEEVEMDPFHLHLPVACQVEKDPSYLHLPVACRWVAVWYNRRDIENLILLFYFSLFWPTFWLRNCAPTSSKETNPNQLPMFMKSTNCKVKQGNQPRLGCQCFQTTQILG